MEKLIKIKPGINIQFDCIFCKSDSVELKEVVFQGIHILADCSCNNCEKEFYHTMPVGHDMLFPVSFDKEGSYSNFDKQAGEWLARPLLDSFFKFSRKHADIEKRVFFERKEVIILNCLDSCFGHVLSRLWNAKLLIDSNPDKGVIVVLPKSMEWLVPLGVAEIWSVGLSLDSLNYYIGNLDSFLKKEISRYEEVYLSPAFIHIDTSRVKLEAYTKIKEFNLAAYNASPPQITFVLRNDRFWHANSFEVLLYNACIKFKLISYFRSYFVRRQNNFINKVARKIKDQLKEVRFFAVGIGNAGGLNHSIQDLRVEKITEITEITEREWCEIYVQSHVVIGVHGSNMLIPTSLAAGFIELLPRHKIPHITEDLALYQPSRYSLFLGRHLDHFASAKLVSLHAVSMIKDFPFLYQNTEKNHEMI